MKWIPAAILVMTAVIVAVLPHPGRARTNPWEIEALPSTQAPAFSLPDLAGNEKSSATFQGQVLLINFWATWCGPCREEMPALDTLQHKFKDKGLAVIGIAIDHEKDPVKQFVAKAKVQFPILHDPEMKTHDDYKVYAYPTTFLVDRKGVIRKFWLGPQDWTGEQFAQTLQEYLQ